ncbi:MAG: hypothetical protein QXX68_01050 [Candidatus Pacearchaeota archaeon]
MKLEKLLVEIQARKIEFDRDKLIDWLKTYANYYTKVYSPNMSKEQIMTRKLEILLEVADRIYWEYGKIFRLRLLPKSRIPACCKYDYEKRVFE